MTIPVGAPDGAKGAPQGGDVAGGADTERGVGRSPFQRLQEAMNHHGTYDGMAAAVVRPDDLFKALHAIEWAIVQYEVFGVDAKLANALKAVTRKNPSPQATQPPKESTAPASHASPTVTQGVSPAEGPEPTLGGIK